MTSQLISIVVTKCQRRENLSKIDFYVTNGSWDWEVQDYLANIWWAFFPNYNMKKEDCRMTQCNWDRQAHIHTKGERETNTARRDPDRERQRERDCSINI